MTAKMTEDIDFANRILVQQLMRAYLHPDKGFDLPGVVVSAALIGNRSGVAPTVTTWLYRIKARSWEMQVRACWNDDQLLEPCAVHCAILGYGPHYETARQEANSWLRSLPGL